jgi:hypothetical protein
MVGQAESCVSSSVYKDGMALELADEENNLLTGSSCPEDFELIDIMPSSPKL